MFYSCRWLWFCFYFCLVWLAVPATAQEAPLTVGVLHQRPNLCWGQEYGALDARIIKMLYGQYGQTTPQRLDEPWYVETTAERITFFAEDPAIIDSAQAFLAQAELWQRQIEAFFPTWSSEEPFSFALPTDFNDRLAFSLLRSPHVLAGRWIDSQGGCLDWPFFSTPQSVLPTGAILAWSIEPQNLTAIELTLWSNQTALRSAKNDVILVVDDAQQLINDGYSLYAEAGTQVLYLKTQDTFAEQWGADALADISQAIPRGALAKQLGDSFIAADSYLNPIGYDILSTDLKYNTRRARANYLKVERPHQILRVLIPSVLEDVAGIIQQALSRTLSINSRLIVADVIEYEASEEDYDLELRLADLDNGTLQRLWHTLLPNLTLSDTVNYVPLVVQRYLYAAKSAKHISAICPSCQRINLN